jgi:hypothetical protein
MSVFWRQIKKGSIEPITLNKDKEFLICLTLRSGKYYSLSDFFSHSPINNTEIGKMYYTNVLIKPKYLGYDAKVDNGFFGYDENKIEIITKPLDNCLYVAISEKSNERLLYCGTLVGRTVISKAFIPKGTPFFINNETGSLSTSRFCIKEIIYQWS